MFTLYLGTLIKGPLLELAGSTTDIASIRLLSVHAEAALAALLAQLRALDLVHRSAASISKHQKERKLYALKYCF
jgi:hypothetical protein